MQLIFGFDLILDKQSKVKLVEIHVDIQKANDGEKRMETTSSVSTQLRRESKIEVTVPDSLIRREGNGGEQTNVHKAE